MNYEIRKVANGYMVTPAFDGRTGICHSDKEVYVFESYQRMVDKLHELLEKKDVQS